MKIVDEIHSFTLPMIVDLINQEIESHIEGSQWITLPRNVSESLLKYMNKVKSRISPASPQIPKHLLPFLDTDLVSLRAEYDKYKINIKKSSSKNMPQIDDEDDYIETIEEYMEPMDDSSIFYDHSKPYEVVDNSVNSGLKFKDHNSASRLNNEIYEVPYDHDGTPSFESDFKAAFIHYFKELLQEFFFQNLAHDDEQG